MVKNKSLVGISITLLYIISVTKSNPMELINIEKYMDRHLRTLDVCALNCFSEEEEGILSRHEIMMITSLPFKNNFNTFFKDDVKKFRQFQFCLEKSLSKPNLMNCICVANFLSCFNLVQSNNLVTTITDLLRSSYTKRFFNIFGINKAVNYILHPIVQTAGSALEKILPTQVTESVGAVSTGFQNFTGSIQNSVGDMTDSTFEFLNLIGSTTKNFIKGSINSATSSAINTVKNVVQKFSADETTTPLIETLSEKNSEGTNSNTTDNDHSQMNKKMENKNSTQDETYLETISKDVVSNTLTACSVEPQLFDGVKSLMEGVGKACAQALPKIAIGGITVLINQIIEYAGDSAASSVPTVVNAFKNLIKKFSGKESKHKKTKLEGTTEVPT